MDSLFNRQVQLPLLTGDVSVDIESIYDYLTSLADYFANYAPVVTQQTDVPSAVAPDTERFWPDSTLTRINYYIHIPDAYAGGDLTVKLYRRGLVTGTAVMDYSVLRFRDNSAAFTVVGTTTINFVATDTNTHVLVLTVPGIDLSKGDVLRLSVTRDGTSGSDTLAGDVVRDGLVVSYPIRLGLY